MHFSVDDRSEGCVLVLYSLHLVMRHLDLWPLAFTVFFWGPPGQGSISFDPGSVSTKDLN